ncbi:hypothetical protein M441DRAFT_55702 [Trichoderma asperellum CBS 433.97]|uniref:Uncharacterized protein n=1 Tax=Trichoderma asperellum (strain ATCC 204424 / CBS 433.97 / NBRC 101777) TaxID=1042311 RepID=A0A2T3ZIQ7_TRIA4|nr:hypothetical protein M441DRAFT_55702 [Trichoderma asperellum CBS 433.97]PTB44676.1 hypothetical protein M441DRAFT_55702 [Trichoderma asperellum CBS 433.97]
MGPPNLAVLFWHFETGPPLLSKFFFSQFPPCGYILIFFWNDSYGSGKKKDEVRVS